MKLSKYFKKLLFLVIFIGFSSAIPAQNCYSEFVNRGNEFLKKNEFIKARDLYEAALSCDDAPSSKRAEIEKLKEQAFNANIAFLNIAVKTAEEAKELAVEQAGIALKRGYRSEANRLALISDIEREKGKDTVALYLAYLAYQYQLQIRELTPLIKRTFGEAVYSYFKKRINLPSPVNSITPFPGTAIVLAVLDNNTVFKVNYREGVFEQLVKHTGYIHPASVALNKDLIITGDSRGEVQISDISGNLITSFQAHQEDIYHISVSPDGRSFLTSSRDNTTKLWDLSGKLIFSINGHRGDVNYAVFSNDSDKILTRSSDGSVQVWDRLGNKIGQIEGNDLYVYDVKFAPDGNSIITGPANGIPKIWSPSGQLIANLEQHNAPVKKVQYHEKEDLLLTVSKAGKAMLWNSGGQLQSALEHDDKLMFAQFSADDRYVISGDENGVVKIWDQKGEAKREIDAHSGAIYEALLTPENGMLLTVGQEGLSKLWDKDNNQLMTIESEGNKGFITYLENGKNILALDKKKDLILCPNPEFILEKMQENLPIPHENIERIKREYQVQTFDDID